MRRVRGWAAVAAVVAMTAPMVGVNAQQVAPKVTLFGGGGVASYKDWPGTTLRVDQDAYVTVFAVTRGRRDFPIAVLSPTSPGSTNKLKAGRKYGVRSLTSTQLLHLVDYGEAPIVVALASTSRPNLEAFMDRGGWGSDLLVSDSTVVDVQGLVKALAQAAYPAGSAYTAEVQTPSNPIPTSYRASTWQFEQPCGGQTSQIEADRQRVAFLSGYGTDLTISEAQNFLYLMGGVQGGLIPGTPYLVSGGNRVSIEPSRTYIGSLSGCSGYRVAWWPRVIIPPSQPTLPAGPARLPADTAIAPVTDRVRVGQIEEVGQPRRGGIEELGPTRSGPIDMDGGTRQPRERVARVVEDPEASAWRRGETGSERRFPDVRDVRRERVAEQSLDAQAILSELQRGSRNRTIDAGTGVMGSDGRIQVRAAAQNAGAEIQTAKERAWIENNQTNTNRTATAPENRRRERVIEDGAQVHVAPPAPVAAPAPAPVIPTPAPAPVPPPANGKPIS